MHPSSVQPKRRGRKPTPHQFVDGVPGKVCRGCGIFQPLENYPKKPKVYSGFASRCKTCATETGRSWRERRRADPLPPIERAEKRCPGCEQTLAASEFPANRGNRDGLHAYCLSCNRAKQAAERARRGEDYREMRRRYRATPEGRAAYLKYRKEHPTKWAAHKAAQAAIKDGRLVRPDRCEQCGETGMIDSHHDDYAQPLEVRWLCRWCHQAWHRQHGEAANANSATI